MNSNSSINGNAYNQLAGPYDVVVFPKNLTGNTNAGGGLFSNLQVTTLIIPSVKHLYDYATYALKCTNFIVLCDEVPTYNGDAWQKYQRTVTNFYVPDHLVSAYTGFLKLGTPKPLSQFIESDNLYANMVKILYERQILVRDWL